MTASEFCRQVEAKAHVTFVRQGRAFVVHGSLPTYLRFAIAGHYEELSSFLVEGNDVEIKVERFEDNLRKLGFTFVAEIPPKGRWVHTLGDAHGESLLAGLIDPEANRIQQARAEAELDAYVTARGKRL